MTLFALTALTMIAFAANSVLGRTALLDGAIDPASYTAIRIAAGALMLGLLTIGRYKSGLKGVLATGNWFSGMALFLYAAAFSFAYVSLETGMGALILFAIVQATMIGWALYTGDRPGRFEWLGLVIAFGAFVWLVSPGIAAPDPIGTVLMVLSGIGWGIYSLRGRSASDPLAATAGNFILAVPAALIILIVFIAQSSLTPLGIVLAVISGAVTSGLGYALWYRVLPELGAVQGAIVQLTVPVIAALGGVIFASEPLTVRFTLCAILILGGVGLSIWAKAQRA